jgi:hypothetical protein
MNEETNHAVLIDRLAAGELDDDARRDLFAWLDREPSHWRRCALALLEARELEEAFGVGAGVGVGESRIGAPGPADRLARPSVVRPSRQSAIFALAASIVVVFSLGVFTRGFFVASAPRSVELAGSPDRETPSGAAVKGPSDTVVKGPETVSDKRPTAVASASPATAQSDLIPPYVRSQLERRGYQLRSRSASLPVVLPDGRRMMVPVDELQLKHVAQRTY